MAQVSAIEWTGSTWNPIVGCSKVSDGCRNCYAERMAKRLAAMARAAKTRGDDPGRAANYLRVIDRDGSWNGCLHLDLDAVDDPLKWRTPRTVFVNSMSDLFHEAVPLEFIQRVFGVMNRCPQHTFQILTKRPGIAARLSGSLTWTPNIWMGTTVESNGVRQRIDDLKRTGAAVKFLSVEPLLGAIPRLPLCGIDWVIVGGESGPGARPMKSEWVQEIRDRCVSRRVPFFFKQWGGVNKKKAGRVLDGRTWDDMPAIAS
ncbi:MAG: phage Gp37/Gp68 family protein [Planctomycetes bacterium]|nr:phage Gp37/Gp68 family protein [Planctomycetota bacterium]